MKILRYLFILIIILLICTAIYLFYPKSNDVSGSTFYVNDTYEVYELNLGLYDLDTINPLYSNNNLVALYSKLMFNSLFDFDENFNIYKSLTKEYCKLQDKVYLLTIYDNILFHNGDKLKAEDIKNTIDEIKNNEKSIFYDNVKNIDIVEIIDDFTIKLVLYEDEILFEYNLIFPIVKETDKNIYGTGIFQIEKAHDRYVFLKRFDDYFIKEKLPKLEKINIEIYGNLGEVFNAFKMGNIDLLTTNNLEYSSYIGNYGYIKKEYKSRNAIIALLNRNTLDIDERKHYYYLLTNVLESDLGYRLNSIYDFIDSFNKKNNNVDKINKKVVDRELKLYYTNDLDNKYRENLKEKLTDSNISLSEINKNKLEKIISNNDFDILFIKIASSIIPNFNFFIGKNNILMYNNEEIGFKLNELMKLENDEQIFTGIKEIENIINNDYIYVPLLREKNVLIYSNNVIGKIEPNWYNIFYNISDWYKQF